MINVPRDLTPNCSLACLSQPLSILESDMIGLRVQHGGWRKHRCTIMVKTFNVLALSYFLIISPKLTMSTALSASTALLSSQSYKDSAMSSRTQRIILECIETNIASVGPIKNGWYPKEIASLSHMPPTQKEGMKISSCIT